MDKLLKGVRSVLYGFSVVAMSVMLVIIFAQVVTRYLFNYTPEWSEELARFLFVWVVFLGSALIMGESGHLAVQFLPDKFKGTAFGTVLDIVINVCGYVFIGLLLTQGWKMTSIMTFQRAPGLDIPMSWVYVIIPVSCVLMLLYLFRETLRIFRNISGRGTGQEG
ncbi:TRAP transporter small permease [Desulfomicrobium escambiense]|uniref:TRAP transporter small permease n=1 Tax=Desulfomicrobium escambiense TaxID=29503 RepID=UPI0004095181|nr:TRAP transporter small permease [Desulfomicrobium escambiense]